MKTTAINTSVLPVFRFFAACIVLFFHFGQKTEYYQQVPAILKAGPQMVTFFFVLSGFVLFLGYQQRERVSLRQYFMKRAIKILPLYLLAFLMSAVFRVISGQLSFGEFFLNLLCLQSWFPHPTSLNFTSWFVSDLMFFYCVFPFILFFLKKTKPDRIQIAIASVLLWAITQGVLITLLNNGFYTGFPSSSHDLIFYFPLSHFCSFFMGICGAYCVQAKDVREQQGESMSLLVSLLVLCAVGLLVQFQPQLTKLVGLRLPFQSSFYAPVFMVFIANVTLFRNPLLRVLSWHHFVVLGEMSYALYILQAPIDTLYNYFIPENFVMQSGMRFSLFFVFLLSAAFLATFFEKLIVRRMKVII